MKTKTFSVTWKVAVLLAAAVVCPTVSGYAATAAKAQQATAKDTSGINVNYYQSNNDPFHAD